MDLQKQMNELLELSFNGQIGVTTFEERVKKYAETYHVLQLQQAGVIQQRELLFAFEKFRTEHIINSTDEWRYANVDLFLSKQ